MEESRTAWGRLIEIIEEDWIDWLILWKGKTYIVKRQPPTFHSVNRKTKTFQLSERGRIPHYLRQVY